jgi:short-subunit dehydrogenase
MAWPGAAAYIATRWAIRGLTECLRAELHGSAIGVTLAAFAQVSSEFWEHNPGSWERLPAEARRLRTLTPAEAAAAIVHAIEHDKRLVLRPRALYALRIANALFARQVERRMWRSAAKQDGIA